MPWDVRQFIHPLRVSLRRARPMPWTAAASADRRRLYLACWAKGKV